MTTPRSRRVPATPATGHLTRNRRDSQRLLGIALTKARLLYERSPWHHIESLMKSITVDQEKLNE